MPGLIKSCLPILCLDITFSLSPSPHQACGCSRQAFTLGLLYSLSGFGTVISQQSTWMAGSPPSRFTSVQLTLITFITCDSGAPSLRLVFHCPHHDGSTFCILVKGLFTSYVYATVTNSSPRARAWSNSLLHPGLGNSIWRQQVLAQYSLNEWIHFYGQPGHGFLTWCQPSVH